MDGARNVVPRVALVGVVVVLLHRAAAVAAVVVLSLCDPAKRGPAQVRPVVARDGQRRRAHEGRDGPVRRQQAVLAGEAHAVGWPAVRAAEGRAARRRARARPRRVLLDERRVEQRRVAVVRVRVVLRADRRPRRVHADRALRRVLQRRGGRRREQRKVGRRRVDGAEGRRHRLRVLVREVGRRVRRRRRRPSGRRAVVLLLEGGGGGGGVLPGRDGRPVVACRRRRRDVAPPARRPGHRPLGLPAASVVVLGHGRRALVERRLAPALCDLVEGRRWRRRRPQPLGRGEHRAAGPSGGGLVRGKDGRRRAGGASGEHLGRRAGSGDDGERGPRSEGEG